ncbi:MAG: serine/threonine protein kinase, partial [Ktedonobacteraceae bacterium]
MQYETLLAGAYQVEKTLYRSTYSVLCAGKRPVSGQEVRLRLWLTAHVTSPEEQQRIRAEVAAIQAVQHPHLLPILEVRATEQGVLLVSASAQAGSLNTRLSQHFLKPLPLAEALNIVNQVGQALHALHERGITHGNLTPLAIFLTEPGRVCLGEFHLHSIQHSIQGYQPLLDENIPRCWYMAPEQFSGLLDARTDQYALGCLAYVLLTGRVPFAGSARATLLQKHQHEQPRSLSVLNADVPERIEEAVQKALAKTPGERHSSVLAFLAALGVLAATVETSVMAPLELAPEIVSPINEEPNAATNLLSGAQVGGSAPEIKQPKAGAALNMPVVEQLEPVTLQAFTEMETLKQPALDGASEQANTVEGATFLPAASVAGFSAISPIARGTSRVPRSGASQATGARGITVLAP